MMVGVEQYSSRVKGVQEMQGYLTSTMATHSLTQDKFILAIESENGDADADVLCRHFISGGLRLLVGVS
jgi:hypothetical protein